MPEESSGARRRYGHYVTDHAIGKGGMATVYAAVNERTGADVALKIVHEGEHTEEARARFEHEASIAGKLQHKNIVRVYDFLNEPDGTSILVMERLRGESLSTILARKGKLGVQETLAIVLPVLSALDHTHREGIVHRDVKPSNVFLAVEAGGEVVPKLLDFGIATRPLTSPHLTADDEVLGTPRAMSPEQIRGDGVLDGRSDLFSLASLVVELLTGEAPFAAKTAAASLVAVLEREVDPSRDIPDRLFLELERALRKIPYERHASAKELADGLKRSVDGLDDEALAKALAGLAPRDETSAPVTESSTSPVERRKRPNAVRKFVVPLALAGAAAVTIAFVIGSRFGAQGGEAAAADVTSTSSGVGSSRSPSASSVAPSTAAESAKPDPVPGASAPTSSSVTSASSAPKPVATGAATSSSGKGGKKTPKPVATRPDF
jgi:serine/threonine-protein kinase